MALAPGTRLGPFEIKTPLGAGGMGEVYRARDTRLGRDVAVKVLPQHLSASPEDRARFRREAKTISGLNHPHICVLHDVGQEGDTDYLVMELVEGETLAQRLARGPLPTADALKIGAQIADALDRAHGAGVTHRDLKPGNVMLTRSGAKLMDFGLARSVGGAQGAGPADATATAPDRSPKSDEPITAKGTVIGTFQYMAPEQLEGKAADARSDIWALGCVLYEMATGKRAFEGSTSASLISAIMRDQPREMAVLAPLTPPALERVVRQSLAKDPDDRWQSAGDLKRELQWIADGGSNANSSALATRSRERFIWVVASVMALALVTMLPRPKPKPKPVIFELGVPAEVATIDLPSISPDGRTLAFNATDSSGKSSIWVRRMDSLTSQRLAGTEGAGRPFWSPDSRQVGYFNFGAGKLMKINSTGGPSVALCNVKGGDGTWSHRGFILFDGGSADSIRMIPASGGRPIAATTLDRSGGESSAAWPQFLPDGRHFLYIASGQDPDVGALKVGSIDSRETRLLIQAVSKAQYASGYILYVSGGALIARPFDARGLKFTGEPIALAQSVGADASGNAQFSASSEGTLAYRRVPAAERIVWVSRRGDLAGTVGAPGYYRNPALSPDGTRLAITVTDSAAQHSSIWIWDLASNLGTKLSVSDRFALAPVWSPDGKRLVYGMRSGDVFNLFVQAVDGGRAEELLYSSNEIKDATDWTRDGRVLYMMRPPPFGDDVDIYSLSMGESVRPVPIVATRAPEFHSALSPGANLLAYESPVLGTSEIFLRSFPAGGPWRVSAHGGAQPAWRGDGRELYYLTPEGSLMEVDVGPGPRFSVPRKLFNAPVRPRADARNQYAPTRDGRKFLFVQPEAKGATATIVLNWPAMIGGR
jgi:serine/threonine protein kinase